jgi:hypothetical protein
VESDFQIPLSEPVNRCSVAFISGAHFFRERPDTQAAGSLKPDNGNLRGRRVLFTGSGLLCSKQDYLWL